MSERFTVTFMPMRGVDGVRALRWLLKAARRRFGLVAVNVREEPKPDAATVAARDERTLERIGQQTLARHHADQDAYFGDDHES